MKTWKNLFIKEEGSASEEKIEPAKEPGFPVEGTPRSHSKGGSNPYLDDILRVYEQGLEKINMPGYDFYEFFNSINAAGNLAESTYKMAFQMGKTMDKTISPEKLVSDAEYYLSKIGEVHQTYTRQGTEKLRSIESHQNAERTRLMNEGQSLESEIKSLKDRIKSLEKELTDKQSRLAKIEDEFRPQKEEISQKLEANDKAMNLSLEKINVIKAGILEYLK